MTEKDISDIIELYEGVEVIAKRLAEIANEAGGADNIPIVLVDAFKATADSAVDRR